MLHRRIVSITLTIVAAALAAGCAQEPKTPASLSPEGAEVAVAMDTPSPRLSRPVGKIRVSAAARGLSNAEQAAQWELRNRAAKMGATLVKIDDDIGEVVLLSDETRVTLSATAYRGD